MAQTEDQATVEWCEQAQKILAYPEDFWLRRQQVAGLAAKLVAERQARVPAGALA